MKKLILITIAMLLLQGCQPKTITIRSENKLGSTEHRQEAANFIIECARAANPMSDEEGEDLVAQCEYTAAKLYGQKTYYAWIGQRTACRDSKTRDEAYKCAVKIRGYKND